MHASRPALLVLLLTTAGLIGCEPEVVVETVYQEETGEQLVDDVGDDLRAVSPEVPLSEVKAIELTEASNARLQEIIAEHKGKVVVVDFWATWCTTCMALMPHTAELQQRHADDLVVITVSLDDADQAPVAKEFLAGLDGEFINLLSSVGGGPKTLDEYELGDGIPHYKFYDREGNLAKELNTDQERLATNESIDAAANELLAK